MIGMGVKEVYLGLQLVLPDPVIVALQKGQVFSLAGRKSFSEISRHAEVPLSEQWQDFAGAATSEIDHNRAGAIG